jgi:hypothetical protein
MDIPFVPAASLVLSTMVHRTGAAQEVLALRIRMQQIEDGGTQPRDLAQTLSPADGLTMKTKR